MDKGQRASLTLAMTAKLFPAPVYRGVAGVTMSYRSGSRILPSTMVVCARGPSSAVGDGSLLPRDQGLEIIDAFTRLPSNCIEATNDFTLS